MGRTFFGETHLESFESPRLEISILTKIWIFSAVTSVNRFSMILQIALTDVPGVWKFFFILFFLLTVISDDLSSSKEYFVCSI